MIKANPRWQAMCAHLRSIQTQGVQIWLSRDQEDLQRMMPDAMASNDDGPLNVWADMTHLLPIESWQASKEKPRRLIYFCGAMETAGATPGPQAHAFPAAETAMVQDRAAMWLKKNGPRTGPGASTAGPEMAFDWNAFAVEKGRDGHARLDAHYFRANIDPTQRYILSVQGNLPYRLRSDEPGFTNSSRILPPKIGLF